LPNRPLLKAERRKPEIRLTAQKGVLFKKARTEAPCDSPRK